MPRNTSFQNWAIMRFKVRDLKMRRETVYCVGMTAKRSWAVKREMGKRPTTDRCSAQAGLPMMMSQWGKEQRSISS